MNASALTTLWTLMRRELWESRGAFKWTPAIVAGMILLFVAFSLALGARFDAELAFTLDGIRMFAAESLEQRRLLVSGALFSMAIVFYQVLILVVLFYLAGSLYDDRRDRSILFWKSLPVSDRMTVASKVLTACLLAPAIFLIAAAATQVVLLLVASVYSLLADVNPLTTVWQSAALHRLWLVMGLGMLVQALWLLPIYGWLVFVSSWAPRFPILIAIGIPLGVALLQNAWSLVSNFRLPELNLGLIMIKRLASGAMPASIQWQVDQDGSGVDISDVHFDEARFMSLGNMADVLAKPEMWIGVVIGLALLAAAVWFRRRATDS